MRWSCSPLSPAGAQGRHLTITSPEHCIEQVLATNPVPQKMSVEEMTEAADLGAYIEFIYYSASPSRRGGPPYTMAEYADGVVKPVGEM